MGWRKDLPAASLEDVAQFFATYYTPDNAVLSIAGDRENRVVGGIVGREKLCDVLEARGGEIFPPPHPEKKKTGAPGGGRAREASGATSRRVGCPSTSVARSSRRRVAYRAFAGSSPA